jgi:FKBP-type peptidyl-prolyl cis-trans isomerase FklB
VKLQGFLFFSGESLPLQQSFCERLPSMIPFSRILPLLALATWVSCQPQPSSPAAPANWSDSVSYSLGMDWAKRYSRDSLPLNPEMIALGYQQFLDSQARFDENQARDIILRYNQEAQSRFFTQMSRKAIENQILQRTFLETNRQKPGIVELPSGLQYKVLASGAGPSPSGVDTVRVNYEGRLLDGTLFDSDQMGKGPAIAIPNDMITGWKEALTRMKPGDKWELYIPSELAFGQQGYPAFNVPPNALLIYELELLEVMPAR